jgi:hypothetical protein
MWMVVPMAVVGHKVAVYHDAACAATKFFQHMASACAECRINFKLRPSEQGLVYM